MIVSYETLRTLSQYLVTCSIGLLLCDEGHRLKNSGTQLQYSFATACRLICLLVRITNIPGSELAEREAPCHPLGDTHPGKPHSY